MAQASMRERTPVRRHSLPRARMPAMPVGQLVGCVDLRLGRLDANRRITDGFPALDDGGDIGQHPVVAAILAAVLDDARPGFAALDGAPQVLEGGFGHIRVAHDVVGGAHQFLAREAADFHERGIGVNDAATGVGAGDQVLLVVKRVFLVVNRLIVAHASVVL
ncbi:hypothetical protein G6F31_018758 [Rhizopus arrhizus]|nr:hypothetical protein G6F31_018758 [Rhizopus arrhizus]